MVHPVFLPAQRGNKTTLITSGPNIWDQATSSTPQSVPLAARRSERIPVPLTIVTIDNVNDVDPAF